MSFNKQELYAVYLPVSAWLDVLECLFDNPKYVGLSEYIGDELGFMISIHPRHMEARNSCKTCMHRDECIVRTTEPICEHYLNVKVNEKKGDKEDG